MKNRSIIRSEINNYYRAKVISWLASHIKDKRDVPEDFPTHLYLGAPTKDEEVLENKDAFLSFCAEWNTHLPAGHIEFIDKSYDELGTVKVPIHLVFDTPDELAIWAGHLVEYHSAVRCLDLIAQEVPELIDSALNVISSLANLAWIDFERMVAVSKWFCEHRDSECLIRQIPIRGVDTRWFELHSHLLLDFLRDYLELNPYRKDLLQLGLTPPPSLVRMVVFDQDLRTKIGGMRLFATSIQEMEQRVGMACRYFVSIDYGTHNPCSMGLWCITGQTAYRIDESYFDSRKERRQRTDEEHYTELERLVGNYPIDCIVIDPSAASFIETIRRHGRFIVRQAENDVLNGIRITAALLSCGKIKIHARCTNAIREFGSYRWDEKRGEDAVIKEYDHAMDDIRYFAATILSKEFRWIPWARK